MTKTYNEIIHCVEEALQDIRQGRMVVLIDDPARENEGDLVCAAQMATPEIVNFMATHGRGMICLPLTGETCERLKLHPQTAENTATYQTAFTVTIDAREGITTGISAADRALTIQQAIADDCHPEDLARPGHIFPLRARDGGVLVRPGQTEGAVDLARLAGLKPAGVICEIMNPDGSMARLPELQKFCKEHQLKMLSIADLFEYRLQREPIVQRVEQVDLPTEYGSFRLIGFQNTLNGELHLALTIGDVGAVDSEGKVRVQDEPVLIRVHSECLTGDIFHSQRCDCGAQLHVAMERIAQAGKGAIVYLRQEGRGIGLLEKLRAYHLQDVGMDTVQANEWLGHPPDKRDYGVGAQICRELGLRQISVMTNNPKKTERLEVFGLKIVEQVPLEITASEHNRRYLKAKRDKMGHLLKNL